MLYLTLEKYSMKKKYLIRVIFAFISPSLEDCIDPIPDDVKPHLSRLPVVGNSFYCTMDHSILMNMCLVPKMFIMNTFPQYSHNQE